MLVAWDVFVGVAILLWLVLRLLHCFGLWQLGIEATLAEEAEEADVWAGTRRSAWEARRRLWEARREAFVEVAKPLEPYIAVFVLFAAPAFIMSTSYCQSHSGATETVDSEVLSGLTANNFSYVRLFFFFFFSILLSWL
jgi:hypothetical protein